MRDWIKDRTKDCVSLKAIGSGGNINKIASFLKKQKGTGIEKNEIRDALAEINPYDYHSRVVKLGMRPDRADVITHAGLIYLNCLEWSDAKKMVVPQVGLPDGIITDLYRMYKNQLK